MACTYEEEIYQRDGQVNRCGCPNCPYKNPIDCIEITPIMRGLTRDPITGPHAGESVDRQGEGRKDETKNGIKKSKS